MIPKLKSILGAGFLAGVLLLAGAVIARARPVSPLGHEGRWVTDARGRVVILHGVNMVYKRPPYHPGAVGFDADDAAFLRENGLNNVRVGVIYAGVEPQPGVYDDAYLDQIESTVATLDRYAVVSLVDFHQDMYNERFSGEGWPDWAVQDDGLPHQPDLGFPGNYFRPDTTRAFDHFWANDPGPGGVGLQDRYAAAWRHVAARFRRKSGVLGYDLLNEPWPGSDFASCANPVGCPGFDAKMKRFIERTIKAIRQADGESLIWFEPNVVFNSGADQQLGAFDDKRLGFSFHIYCLARAPAAYFSDDPVGGTSCDTQEDLTLQNALNRVKTHDEAILMTEYGATDDLVEIKRMTDRVDRAMVPWQWWAYCGCADPTTAGPGAIQAIVIDPAKPLIGDNIKDSKLAILSRPYPQVVAGVPEKWGFDETRRELSLTFPTRRVGGGTFASCARSEVYVGRRYYPDGYHVEVSGADVVSSANALTLRLATRPGADRIRVLVKPGAGSVTAPRRVCRPFKRKRR